VRSDSRPQVDVPESVSTSRSPMLLVVVREKLGLISGNIHFDRAIGFAAFASQAELERLFDSLVLPAVANHSLLRHLPKKVCAAASGMPLILGGAVAGTHDTT